MNLFKIWKLGFIKYKYIIVSVFVFFIFLILSVIYSSNYYISKFAQYKTFDTIVDIKSEKVGLLLGTSKYIRGGGINLYFKYRIDAAVMLFASRKISYILVSGDNSLISYNEPITMQRELLKRGIPADRIYLDYAGFRTLDSVIRAKEVFGLNSAIVISQRFHNERAIYLAENYGLNLVGFNARGNKNISFTTRWREYFARVRAFFDTTFNVSPKFLGERIIISNEETNLGS